MTRPVELASSGAGSMFLDCLTLALGDSAPASDAAQHAIGVASGDSYAETRVTTLLKPQATEPLLSAATEELLATSSDSSHVAVLVSLPWINGEGSGLLQGVWAPLSETLKREIDREWRAALLSAELIEDGNTLYWELRLVGGRGTPETQRARKLASLASAWREDLVAYARAQPFSPHAQELLRALPGMISVLGRTTRVGADEGQTVVNGYLPAAALHNLALAAQLLIAEQNGLSGDAEDPGESVPSPSRSLAERLARPVTIRFGRESLEAAVAIIGQAIEAPLTINGRDLQLQGITRNQMVGLDVRETPASDALVQLLLQANPDPEATGPADRRQQLVFVLDEAGGEIVITTRSAAAQRGDALPEVFRQ